MQATAKKILFVGIISLCFINLSNLFAQSESIIKMVKVSERVYLFMAAINEKEGFKNYYPVIASETGLIIVDTPMYPSVAEELKKKIVKELGRSDFIYLINTHYHWDHTGGNQAFAEAEIIGHEFTPVDMKKYTGVNFKDFIDKRKKDYEKRNDNRVVELLSKMEKDFRAAPPTRIFSDREIIKLKDITMVLYHVGRDGSKPTLYNHARSDIFLYIPEEGALCAGDVYFNKEWLNSFPLDQLTERYNGFMKFCQENGYGIKHVFFGHDPYISK